MIKNMINVMKSLKNTKSINQISKDYLLGITKQPDITCPIINALQFSGNNRSKIYKCELGEDPSGLTVDTSELIKTIENLKSWATDVCDVYNDNELSIEDTDDRENIVGLINLVEQYLDQDYISEIQDHEKEINKIIDSWEEYNSSYEEQKSYIDDLEKKQEELETALDNYDSDNEDDYDEIESIKDNIFENERDTDRANRHLESIERDFRYDVEMDFDKAVENFTIFLEKVRSNNDNMRTFAYELRENLVTFIKDEYDLRQPMQYLKEIESGKDNEISLGILTYPNFNQLMNYLERNEIVSPVQKKIMNKNFDKNELISLLQNIGYEKIRYYESDDSFLTNKELYKEVDLLKTKNVKENKLKIQ